MRKINLYISSENLRAMLRELGFNYKGQVCSFIELFKACERNVG